MKTKLALLFTLFFTVLTFSQKKWTLKDCVTHALKNNLTVKENRLNIGLAEKDVAIAEGNFLPNLGLSNSHRGSFGLSSGITGVNTTEDRYSTNFNLGASGTIFNGFRNLNTKKQAQLSVKSTQLRLQKIEDDIALNVINSYLNVLFAKENLAVAKAQLEVTTQQVKRAKAQFDAGAIPKGDLLNVQSTLANDTQNIVRQENALDLALLNLSQLLQVPVANFDVASITVDNPSVDMFYGSSKEVLNKALLNRPEIQVAKMAVENADLSIKIAKGAYLPTLGYTVNAGTSYFTVFGEPDQRVKRNANGTVVIDANNNPVYEDFGFFKQLDEQLNYSVGLSLNIPIFNRFQTKNQVAKSIIRKEQSEIRLTDQKRQLQQIIEKAYLDAKLASKTYEAAKIAVEAQKEAFKNAQIGYDYGTITQFDFDQIRNRLSNSESALIRAKYDYIFKTKVLQFYYGDSVLE